jgi:predicted alpha/beta superfamily hydrolase
MNKLRAALLIVLTAVAPAGAQNAQPLVIGETFDLRSRIMGEVRRINVYAPSIYLDSTTTHLPVLFMPDGGIAEDFLHIAGLVQVSVGNGTMRPFLLVGIENTERRRDMTGPTTVASDRSIAPQVGGSSRFRAFIRDELMPYIKEHYPVTDESAIMGESLAGLFVVETFLLEPELFDTYIAFDPSLWWDNGRLVREVGDRIRRRNPIQNTIYLAHSDQPDIANLTRQFAETFKNVPGQGVTLHFQPLPNEQHATIYHPAALLAFRSLFKPEKRDSTK